MTTDSAEGQHRAVPRGDHQVVDAFVADYWDVHRELDQQTPLWDSLVEQLEFWPATSLEATRAREATLAEWQERAEGMLDGVTDATQRASLQTVAAAALLERANTQVQTELYWAHPTLGLQSYLHWAVNDFPLVTPEHGDRWLEKLRRLPGALDELSERLRHAAGEGRTMLRRHLEASIAGIDEQLDTPVEDDPLTRQAPPTALDDDAAATEVFRAAAVAGIREHVRPALAALRATLADLVDGGRDDDHPGLCHVPGGDATYAELVRGFVEPGVTAEQVHQTGLDQVASLAREYAELGEEVFGTDDVADVLARLRDDDDLHFDTAEEVVARAEELHAAAEQVAPEWFARVPVSPCRIQPTTTGSLAFYSRPSPDGSRPGVFYFNVSDPTVWGPNLASTVFHEGIPGHHFQLALALEDAGLPGLHQNAFLPAFGEGWGLYTERLADEMGLFETPFDRFGMLANDSLRACRLVVDTGMHALGWTRQQAIDVMLEHSPLREAEVVAEVDRYIGMPGQACSYMMGRLAIEEVRDAAADRLGDAYDARGFHDVVLSRGTVSLPALRTLVHAWDGATSR